MTRLSNLTLRNLLIALHDALATTLAVLASFYLRFEGDAFFDRLPLLLRILPYFVAFSVVVCYFFNLTTTKWRFISLPDALNILRVATVLTLALLVLDYIFVAPNVQGRLVAPNLQTPFFLGKITIILYWFLEVFFLSGLRFAYRYFRYSRMRYHARTEGASPTLLIGRAADAEILLRGIESGAVKHLWPVGVLSPSPADRGQLIRSIPVLGGIDDVEDVIADFARRNKPITRVVMTPSAFEPDARPESVLMRARRLGLIVSRLPSLEGGETPAVDGRCRRGPVASSERKHRLRPARGAGEEQGGHRHRGRRFDRLGDLRQGRDIRRRAAAGDREFGAGALRRHRSAGGASDRRRHRGPDRGYSRSRAHHAADEGIQAGYRVPRRRAQARADTRGEWSEGLERDWSEGVKTNIFGSINVADAALAAGAEAMVMISTDKAIEPVSMLGLTKRFAEMYCQALDHDLASQSGPGAAQRMRLISVRFGNVLASNGSVVPKFKAQIEAGGPVTVTHPDMVRYFMTIREACDLVITAATHALAPARPDVSVYVLNMGQPVKIVDLAERMIRLSGLEPGHDIDIVFHRHAAGRTAE